MRLLRLWQPKQLSSLTRTDRPGCAKATVDSPTGAGAMSGATRASKEARDGAKIQKLSQQVAVLKVELQSVRSESERDGLTGILNRRSFDRLAHAPVHRELQRLVLAAHLLMGA